MRRCEHGACTEPAVYRGPRNERGEAAWCEPHVPMSPGAHPPRDPNPFPGVEFIPGAQGEVKP